MASRLRIAAVRITRDNAGVEVSLHARALGVALGVAVSPGVVSMMAACIDILGKTARKGKTRWGKTRWRRVASRGAWLVSADDPVREDVRGDGTGKEEADNGVDLHVGNNEVEK